MTDIYRFVLGATIAQIREHARLKQTDLAQKAGVTQATVGATQRPVNHSGDGDGLAGSGGSTEHHCLELALRRGHARFFELIENALSGLGLKIFKFEFHCYSTFI